MSVSKNSFGCIDSSPMGEWTSRKSASGSNGISINEIRVSGQDYTTSLAFFFEIVAQAGQAAADPHGAGQQFFLQYITKYLHADGSMRCRVTTLTRMCAAVMAPLPPSSPASRLGSAHCRSLRVVTLMKRHSKKGNCVTLISCLRGGPSRTSLPLGPD